jgi:hypothetical protein
MMSTRPSCNIKSIVSHKLNSILTIPCYTVCSDLKPVNGLPQTFKLKFNLQMQDIECKFVSNPFAIY